jgi:hypothetical protein
MRAVSDSLGDTDHSSPPEWKKLTDVRTNKEFEKLRTYVIITKNYVSYSGLSEEPYGILIKSKETVEREKMIFEIFWKSCKSKA